MPTKTTHEQKHTNTKIAFFILLGTILLGVVVVMMQNFSIDSKLSTDYTLEGKNESSTSQDTSGSADGNNTAATDDSTSTTPDFSALEAVNSRAVIDLFAAKGTAFLYIGRPTCPYCQAFVPTLIEVVKENNFKVLYYDTDAATSEPELKNQVFDLTDISGVPVFMYIKDGIIADTLQTRTKAAVLAFINKNK